jgi:hypothetical protein
MAELNCDSRQSIYFGVNYIVAIPWTGDKSKQLDFQRVLLEQQLDFPEVKAGERTLTLIRKEQSSLKIQISSLGPQVSGIRVSSEGPYDVELFAKEAEEAYAAYHKIWVERPCHIVQCEAMTRHLYSCDDHAFKYLWETRLGQKADDFRRLGERPVLGGGLRLVIPPISNEPEPNQIEIKIESFLKESRKMFIETLFVWPPTQPRLLDQNSKFDPEFRLKCVVEYATNEVWNFLLNPKAT